MKTSALFLLLLALAGCARKPPESSPPGSFTAYSLRVAEDRVRRSGASDDEAYQVAGITSLAGMVYNAQARDLIVVGRRHLSQPAISVDDFAVAMRCVMLHDELPLVSIDRTPQTDATGMQTVVFNGHIENTRFGRDLLEADILLKKAAFGLLGERNSGIRSYVESYVNECRQKGTEDLIASRFWFYIAGQPAFAAREGVFAIRSMRIGVETQVLYAMRKGALVRDVTDVRDPVGDEFSADMTRRYFDLALRHAPIGRIKTLLDLVSLALGVQQYFKEVPLGYWLKEYPVARIETPKQYELLRKSERITTRGGRLMEVSINGGVAIQAQLLRLKAGDTTALRDAVLASRPGPGALAWTVPLEGWQIPDALPFPEDATPAPRASPPKPGFALEAGTRVPGTPAPRYNLTLPSPAATMPSFVVHRDFALPGEPKLIDTRPPGGAAPRSDPRGGISADVKIGKEDFAEGKEKKK